MSGADRHRFPMPEVQCPRCTADVPYDEGDVQVVCQECGELIYVTQD